VERHQRSLKPHQLLKKEGKKHVGVENENEGERWQQGACIKKTTDDQ
jgi:hypothetical protein